MSRQRRTPARAISLRCEVETIRHAIDGARLLGDILQHDHAPTAQDERSAPASQTAILTLAVQRLALLDAVLAGDAEPSQLAAPHNVLHGADDLDDDVAIPLTRDR